MHSVKQLCILDVRRGQFCLQLWNRCNCNGEAATAKKDWKPNQEIIDYKIRLIPPNVDNGLHNHERQSQTRHAENQLNILAAVEGKELADLIETKAERLFLKTLQMNLAE